MLYWTYYHPVGLLHVGHVYNNGLVQTYCILGTISILNTVKPEQNGRHFPDDLFKCIFLTETVHIFIQISLKFIPQDPVYDILSLV